MLLELKGITVFYGKARAVENVSLNIAGGTVAAIIGANGAGKSTILKAVSGLVPLHSGEIRFAGQRIDGKAPYRIVGMGLVHVPEGRRLFPHLSVLTNLKLGASLRKDTQGIKKDLSEMFDIFPILSRRRDQKAGTMSGGEQQMLAIARGLMADPKLIMLDEPSLGLAPLMVAELVPVIRMINERGVTVLLVEQNVPLALQVAQTVCALQVGRTALSGDAQKFKDNEEIRRAYLGSTC